MYKKLRPAIAMIELIFSIVIMGIVMLSAPMLISTSTKSTFVSLQQEGINEAASRIYMIMGYDWDEENILPNNITPTILHTTSTTAGLREVGTTKRRAGIPLSSKRAYITELNATADYNASTTLGNDGNDSDDIDDFIAITTVNPIEAATIDYVEKQGKVNINTTITYGSDSVTGGYNQNIITFTPFNASASTTSNIKNITVTLTSTSGVGELTKSIVFQAFMCNIGGYTLEERNF